MNTFQLKSTVESVAVQALLLRLLFWDEQATCYKYFLANIAYPTFVSCSKGTIHTDLVWTNNTQWRDWIRLQGSAYEEMAYVESDIHSGNSGGEENN